MSNQYRDLALQLRGFAAGLGRPCTLLDDAADLLESIGSAGPTVDLAIVANALNAEHGIDTSPNLGGYDQAPHLTTYDSAASITAAIGEPAEVGFTDVWTYRGVQIHRWNTDRYDASRAGGATKATSDTNDIPF